MSMLTLSWLQRECSALPLKSPPAVPGTAAAPAAVPAAALVLPIVLDERKLPAHLDGDEK